MVNPIKPIPCEVLDIRRETETEWTFKVASDVKPNHGQFMQLSLPKIGEAPISISGYGEGYLEFTIRAVGKVTDEIFAMQPGDTLFMRGSYGNGWPFDKQFKGKHLVFVTGGTGLAPVRTMLEACYNSNDVESVTLISGFKNEAGIVFKDDLAKWKEKFTTFYTLDRDQIEGWNVGFVTEYIGKVDFSQFNDNYEVIIVGPPPMMKFTGLAALKAGVPEEKIWMSFERKMSCAVGKCGHCRIDEVYVCTDGPVFNYTVAKGLID